MSINNDIYAFLYSTLGPSSVVLDIGAYVGKVSRQLCNEIKGDPENFHLVEACPRNYKILTKNNKMYNIYNVAIGDVNGIVDFFVGDHKGSEGSSQANSLFVDFIKKKEWNKTTKTHRIKSFTLDSFIREYGIKDIDLLKINCEGAEYKIFSTSTEFLDNVKYLYIQLHGKSPVFLTDEMITKKKKIIKLLETKFELVMGDDTNTKSHIHMLWKRKG